MKLDINGEITEIYYCSSLSHFSFTINNKRCSCTISNIKELVDFIKSLNIYEQIKNDINFLNKSFDKKQSKIFIENKFELQKIKYNFELKQKEVTCKVCNNILSNFNLNDNSKTYSYPSYVSRNKTYNCRYCGNEYIII